MRRATAEARESERTFSAEDVYGDQARKDDALRNVDPDDFDDDDDDDIDRIDMTRQGDDEDEDDDDADPEGDDKDRDKDDDPDKDEKDDKDRKADEEDLSDDLDLPALDPRVSKLLDSDPEAKKAHEEWISKAQKKLDDRREDLSFLDESRPKIENMVAWGDRFEKKEDWQAAYSELGQKLAQMHGEDPPQSLADTRRGEGDARTEGPSARLKHITEENFAQHFATREDFEYAKKLDSLFGLGEILSRLEKVEGTAKSWATESQRVQQKEAFEKEVARIAPNVARHFQRLEGGFRVSKEMVAEALRAMPQLANDPIKAVKAHFTDKIVEFKTRSTAQRQRHKRAPESLPRGDRGGHRGLPKDPSRIRAEDVY